MTTFLRTYPQTRMRRTRLHPWSRRLVRENCLTVNDLIWPIFVCEGENQKIPIATMENVYRMSIDVLIEEAKQAEALHIPAIALFPVVPDALKTHDGKEAINPDNLICRTLSALKKTNLNIGTICDVALDPYTDHGHDGVIIDGEIANDETVAILTRQALIQAQAGCDVIAPSDMQDGRIGEIRKILDQNGLANTLILSYAAKYASHFYGPFRQAIGSQSTLAKKGKHSYQQDYANRSEALHEVSLDLTEGADLIMIKPGMPYLDIIARVKEKFQVPTFAYQVSGEYTMLNLLSKQTGVDRIELLLESLVGFKRAGADAIFTYAAKDIAEFLNNK